MSVIQGIPLSFVLEMWTAIHDFTASTGDDFKLALYLSASHNKDTTAYSTTDEITGTGYTAGGATLTSVTPVMSGLYSVCDFANPSWTSATFSADSALLYNSSKADRAVLILDFGATKSVSSGTFTVNMPSPDQVSAILRMRRDQS